jgi:hypothetical protein
MPVLSFLLVTIVGIIVGAPLPATVINLDTWALAVPVAPSEEIQQPSLSQYRSDFFSVNYLDNGVVFAAPTDGAVQPGSSYPRTELRQIPTWDSSVGTHRMEITESVDALPAEFPSLVVAQVHNADRYVVIVQIIGPRIFVKVDNQDVGTLDANYQLGAIYTLTMVATGGEIRIGYNTQQPVVVRAPCAGCYFKAGAYLQSHTTTPNDIGQVTIYQLKTRD